MRTRKVRAVTESLYGRTARTIGIIEHGDDLPFFEAAQAEADLEAMRTSEDDCGGFTMRHARIPAARASEFFGRVNHLALEFTALKRAGDREFAFLGAIFPTTRPVAPATTSPVAAGEAGVFAFSSLLGILWNVITVSLRQTIIPPHLLGRVNSVYRFFAWGMMPIGAAIGGVVVLVVDAFASRDIALRATWIANGLIHVALFVFGRTKLTTVRIEMARAAGPRL